MSYIITITIDGKSVKLFMDKTPIAECFELMCNIFSAAAEFDNPPFEISISTDEEAIIHEI